jgi:hypothetical protein
VKLTDFGIAQALDDPRLTTSGTLVGSPAYMDPERISQSAVTPASDLWSLGATMFHAVEGYPPFQRETTAATMHAIMTEKPRLRQCTGPLATIISGLLMAAPDARLNTTGVRGLLTAATATLPGESARPAGTPQADGTTVHRDGGFPGATRVTERPRRRWRGRLLLLTAFLLVAALGAVGGFFLGPILTGHSLTSRYLTYGPGGQIPKFDVSSSSPACLSGQLAERRSSRPAPARPATSRTTPRCSGPAPTSTPAARTSATRRGRHGGLRRRGCAACCSAPGWSRPLTKPPR